MSHCCHTFKLLKKPYFLKKFSFILSDDDHSLDFEFKKGTPEKQGILFYTSCKFIWKRMNFRSPSVKRFSYLDPITRKGRKFFPFPASIDEFIRTLSNIYSGDFLRKQILQDPKCATVYLPPSPTSHWQLVFFSVMLKYF